MSTDKQSCLSDLLIFLKASPTPFHAVREISQRLCSEGFTALDPALDWNLMPGQGYFVVRNGSSIIAFRLPEDPGNHRLHIVGAHTDSPCLRIKPEPDITRHSYLQLGVEVYGGALLHPWFDRDLSIAGRVVGRQANGRLVASMVDLQKPVACIPSLAIHLNREANQGVKINPQKDLPAILGQQMGDELKLRNMLQQVLKKQGEDIQEVLDFELSLYDTQAPAVVGLNSEFIASARLDNLLSCYAGLQALIKTNSSQGTFLVCNDHEEIGSQTAEGAQGNFLLSALERIFLAPEKMHQVLHQSMFVSTDNAHGIHPNFADQHDENHGPLLNHGPVIKINANQRYATNAVTSGILRELATQQELPIQSFVVRSDMACGSTIGPIVAAKLGIKTIDLGIPTFAMHSIRELAGCQDITSCIALLTAFYETSLDID